MEGDLYSIIMIEDGGLPLYVYGIVVIIKCFSSGLAIG